MWGARRFHSRASCRGHPSTVPCRKKNNSAPCVTWARVLELLCSVHDEAGSEQMNGQRLVLKEAGACVTMWESAMECRSLNGGEVNGRGGRHVNQKKAQDWAMRGWGAQEVGGWGAMDWRGIEACEAGWQFAVGMRGDGAVRGDMWKCDRI